MLGGVTQPLTGSATPSTSGSASSGLNVGTQAQVLGQPLTVGAEPPANAIPVGARSSGLLGVLGATSVEVYGAPLGQPLDVGVGAGLPDAGDNVVGQLLGHVQVQAGAAAPATPAGARVDLGQGVGTLGNVLTSVNLDSLLGTGSGVAVGVASSKTGLPTVSLTVGSRQGGIVGALDLGQVVNSLSTQVTAIVARLPVPGLAGTLAAQVAGVLGVVRQVATLVTTDQLGLVAVLKTVNMHLSELLTPVRSTVSVVLGGLRVSDLVEGVVSRASNLLRPVVGLLIPITGGQLGLLGLLPGGLGSLPASLLASVDVSVLVRGALTLVGQVGLAALVDRVLTVVHGLLQPATGVVSIVTSLSGSLTVTIGSTVSSITSGRVGLPGLGGVLGVADLSALLRPVTGLLSLVGGVGGPLGSVTGVVSSVLSGSLNVSGLLRTVTGVANIGSLGGVLGLLGGVGNLGSITGILNPITGGQLGLPGLPGGLGSLLGPATGLLGGASSLTSVTGIVSRVTGLLGGAGSLTSVTGLLSPVTGVLGIVGGLTSVTSVVGRVTGLLGGVGSLSSLTGILNPITGGQLGLPGLPGGLGSLLSPVSGVLGLLGGLGSLTSITGILTPITGGQLGLPGLPGGLGSSLGSVTGTVTRLVSLSGVLGSLPSSLVSLLGSGSLVGLTNLSNPLGLVTMVVSSTTSIVTPILGGQLGLPGLPGGLGSQLGSVTGIVSRVTSLGGGLGSLPGGLGGLVRL